jgi:hypothetical protein
MVLTGSYVASGKGGESWVWKEREQNGNWQPRAENWQPSASRQRADLWNSVDLIRECGEPAGTRTQDHLIKSQVLYHLSYGL